MKILNPQTVRRRFAAPLILALAALSLAACADNYVWQNSRRAEHRLSADSAECRANAGKLIDDELRRASPFDIQERGQLERQFTLFDARKRRDLMFTNCMRDKGYKRVKVKPQPKNKPMPKPTAG
jgi:hypothetical protein